MVESHGKERWGTFPKNADAAVMLATFCIEAAAELTEGNWYCIWNTVGYGRTRILGFRTIEHPPPYPLMWINLTLRHPQSD